MQCRSADELQLLVDEAKKSSNKGKVADYIPALQKANKETLSISLFYPDGNCFSAGDIKENLTLQSISKVITLAIALSDRGEEYVFNRVGQEPTGDPFNSIAKLETNKPSKPLNPMINAGALAVTHMIKGSSVNERFERILKLIQRLSGNESIGYNKEVAHSEFKTADLNRSLCYFLKQHRVIDEDVEQLIDLYTRQCAIELNCLDLSRIGCVLAMDGKDPYTEEQLIPHSVARICKTFMVTCGMYNASGEFAIEVGIPAKSGVSGGILGAVPGKFGIGIYGPALDEKGNSIAGMELLKLMSQKYSLSMF
ncbi:glutaminase A [Bacillus sporothermodurans]|uniref:glutaminase A n=1 Tax=Heyndrickxia sporothermodurans TaxID=46224 RepID=UPI00192C1904|nr:glutaminase A [Heyndrickxia sporothermodurans]MBL5774808.1 glutaminase A [Heyndrickxia sporothermodurans]MBL5880229.1 glutaminase A [Heyndrickxia sporothermodurans]MBL5891629.1 glutaminase A [Heyndrickxia sporothermodurans]